VTQDKNDRKRKPCIPGWRLVFSIILVLRGGFAAGRRWISASLRLCGNVSSV